MDQNLPLTYIPHLQISYLVVGSNISSKGTNFVMDMSSFAQIKKAH
jgi:hypothetical protein